MRKQWNAICDVCGFEFLSGKLEKRWDGMMVCKDDFELRHPLDYLKNRMEMSQRLPWIAQEPADIFIGPTYIETGNNTVPDGTFDNSLD